MIDKITETKNKIFELYPENQELVLLDTLSHEFQNFKKNFKSKLKHTFILTPGASAVFPVEIHDGKPVMGVPDVIFEVFMDVRWYVVNVIADSNGLFLTFEIGVPPSSHPAAIRVYKRKVETLAFSRYKRMGFARINNKGETFGFDNKNYFERPIAIKKSIDWEF